MRRIQFFCLLWTISTVPLSAKHAALIPIPFKHKAIMVSTADNMLAWTRSDSGFKLITLYFPLPSIVWPQFPPQNAQSVEHHHEITKLFKTLADENDIYPLPGHFSQKFFQRLYKPGSLPSEQKKRANEVKWALTLNPMSISCCMSLLLICGWPPPPPGNRCCPWYTPHLCFTHLYQNTYSSN